jgi:hypothetical protein
VGTKGIVVLVAIVGSTLLAATVGGVYWFTIFLPRQARAAIEQTEAKERQIRRLLDEEQRKLDEDYKGRLKSTIDETERTQLRLEYERWLLERRMGGRFAPERPLCIPCSPVEARRGRCSPCPL